MDVNRIYPTHTDRVQRLPRVQRVNMPLFEQQREDISQHFSSQKMQKKSGKQDYAHFFHQGYQHSRFPHARQPYAFKKNEYVAMSTCIYVNHTTVKQMITYASNHKEFIWEDMGFDGNSKWIVVCGQRFECKFTDEEIACFEQLYAGTDYVKYLEKNVPLLAKLYVVVSRNQQGILQFLRLGEQVRHVKISALQQNEKAIRFISEVMDFYAVKQWVFMI